MEVQRLILFDTLKNTVVSHASPFILKRTYLRCLFEIYINKVHDPLSKQSNETISLNDVSEILSREIIPQLDTKNIYVYMEGLVRISKSETS